MKTSKNVKEETKEKMIQSAMHIFAINGYNRANIDDISLHAGYGKGTIYNYFSSKVELFLEVIKKFVNDLVCDINSKIQHISDPIEKFKQLVHIDIEKINTQSDLFLTIMHESLTADRDRQSEFLNASSPLFRIYVQVIDEGIKAGCYKEDTDAVSAAIMLMGKIENLALINKIFSNSLGSTEVLVEKITSSFIYGIKKRD